MTKALKILVVEDQGMMLGALSALIELEDDMQVVGKANNGEEAIAVIADVNPNIVVTDIEMPKMTGIELAEYIQQQQIPCKVVVLTTFARPGYLRRAMDAGVKGYLLKDAPSDELASALRKVSNGRKVIDPELAMDAWEETDPLNNRERKALRLASEGLSTEQIAESMFISQGTVRNYLSNTLSKLNAANRIEASRIAKQKGWL